MIKSRQLLQTIGFLYSGHSFHLTLNCVLNELKKNVRNVHSYLLFYCKRDLQRPYIDVMIVHSNIERKGKVPHNNNKAKQLCDEKKDLLRSYNVGKFWFGCHYETWHFEESASCRKMA